MEQQKPQRKRTRLPEYDYNTAGYYFVTACTGNKRCILGEVAGGGVLDAPQVTLSEIGKLVEAALTYLDEHMESIHVGKYVIMPNHIHLILEVRDCDRTGNGASYQPANTMIPSFMSSLKRFTNRQAGQTIWQASYYDHIIRNEADFLRIWQYIDDNPIKWTQDKYYEA